MNRATGTAAARAVDRLLLGNKPAPERCECDDSIALKRRIELAAPLLAKAIRLLDASPSTAFADDAATVALIAARNALCALECE